MVAFTILFSPLVPALAQTNSSLTLSNPDLSQFPQISCFVWPYDEEGSFIKDLGMENVKIQENKRVIAPDSVELLEPGSHFVVAVNEGPTLANRYAGVQRFESIKNQILAWMNAQPSDSVDDFSLVGNSGSVVTRLETPSEWVKALNDYQPDLKAATIGLTSLTTGIDIAADASADTNKTRAVLYITPLPDDNQLQGLQEAASRALELNVHLYIWLIGPQNYISTNGAQILQKAAEDTNGRFFLFSGAETLPDLKDYLDPIHYVYKVSYASEIKSSGNYDFSLQVKQGSLSLSSPTTKIKIEVSAPNPILLSPPIEITRSWIEAEDTKELILSPEQVKISSIIEFPDAHPRALAFSRFFVDDKLVQENTAEPFDEFTWDLTGITSSGTYTLQVTIEDQLGLAGQTIEIPVKVVVEPRPQNWFQKLFSWVTPLNASLIAGIVVLLAMFVGLYLRYRKGQLIIRKETRHRITDPVTQPVSIEGEYLVPASVEPEAAEWPQIRGGELAPARLLRLDENDLHPLAGKGIGIYKVETTLGSSSSKVDEQINGSTVSEVHAVIKRESISLFRIYDAGSSTGTWVNYTPISSQGIALQHGDLIHLGRVVLRFELLHASPRKMQVVPYQGRK